jgi:transposase InsO family protein
LSGCLALDRVQFSTSAPRCCTAHSITSPNARGGNSPLRTVRSESLITDHGAQFTVEEFGVWCRRRGIRQRFGAIGKYGSLAVIERFIRSMKNEGTCTAPAIVSVRFTATDPSTERQRCCRIPGPKTTCRATTVPARSTTQVGTIVERLLRWRSIDEPKRKQAPRKRCP